MSRSSNKDRQQTVLREEHLLATGTWTAPAAMIPGSLVATIINGGYSGANSNSNAIKAVGGNGGGALRRRLANIAPGSVQPVSIGSGGARVATTEAPPRPGGQSSFAGVSGPAVRGSAGVTSNSRNMPADEGAGMAGPPGSTSDTYFDPLRDGIFPPYGGAGGSASESRPGRGGANLHSVSAQDAAANSGGGGSGASGSSDYSGGAGGSGRVILEWEEYAA